MLNGRRGSVRSARVRKDEETPCTCPLQAKMLPTALPSAGQGNLERGALDGTSQKAAGSGRDRRVKNGKESRVKKVNSKPRSVAEAGGLLQA